MSTLLKYLTFVAHFKVVMCYYNIKLQTDTIKSEISMKVNGIQQLINKTGTTLETTILFVSYVQII